MLEEVTEELTSFNMKPNKNSKNKKFSSIKIDGGKKLGMPVKKQKKILEYYYMTPQETDAKDISLCITAVPQEQIEVWPALNLLEVVMDSDSLIFQDARECFEDPLDLEYIEQHGYRTLYQISFEADDIELVKAVMREVLTHKGGRILSDTDDFEPGYGSENINDLA